MTKIDIISGFLGAGKTTLIKKLIKEAYEGEQVVLIENEFGEIGIDGGFLQDAGIKIREMNSGCICCSLVGDFAKALKQVTADYHPDRIIIEPSGVGKLSDIIKAVTNAELEDAQLNSFCTVVDAGKCKMYMKNFGEFFNDQIKYAGSVILSHTDCTSEEKVEKCLKMLKEVNDKATYVTSAWSLLSGKKILDTMERKDSLEEDLARFAREYAEDHKDDEHHHHHHDHDHCCDEEHEHEHHHDHDHCCDEEHEHHHDHDHCGCGHHHHHADEVFVSWGLETSHVFTEEELKNALEELQKEDKYGTVLRAKGIVAGKDCWYHFDYVPGEPDIRTGSAGAIGRLCVIGCKINEDALKELFKA